MSNVRLSDILKNKKPGDEWYTLMAPEQLHKWLLRKPWDSDCFSSKGVHLLAASVSSFEPLKTKNNKDIRATKKEPLRMSNGIDIEHGYFKTSTSKLASFKIRADSSVEFSEIMTELAGRTGLDIWDIDILEIANNKLGTIIEFKVLNPDTHGSRLYLYRVTSEGNSRLYPDVLLSTQEEVVGNFYDKRRAHCTCAEVTDKIHGCAVQYKAKSRQIKIRKKSTTLLA